MAAEPIPVVLLSLPRSGSTLVQRILGSHDGVATASEPWVLLPWLLPLRSDVPAAGAWQPRINAALRDFALELPDGLGSYEQAVGQAARTLYAEAAGGASHYVDKTPPYFLVIDEIARTLPEARLVFLWRNPLAVLASVVETFCAGRWQPQDYPTSLFIGLARLVDGWGKHQDRACAVRYEDLIDPDLRSHEWRRLTAFLGIPFDPSSLQRFADLELRGEMGDPTGVKRYGALDSEPTRKWEETISNPVRREWARRYLKWIGEDRLATMGYDAALLRRELSGTKVRPGGSGADLARAMASIGRDLVKARAGHPIPSTWRALFGAHRNGWTRD